MLNGLNHHQPVHSQAYRSEPQAPQARSQEAQPMPTEQFAAQDPSSLLLAQTLEVLKTVAAQNQQLASQNQQLANQLAAANTTNQQISDKLQQHSSGPVRFRQLAPEKQQEMKSKLQSMARNGRLFLRGRQSGRGFVEDPAGTQFKRLTSGGAAARIDRGKPVELIEMTRQLDVENHSSYSGRFHQKYLWSMGNDGMIFGGSKQSSERGHHQEDKLYGEWFAAPVDSWDFLDWEDPTATGLPTAGVLQEGVAHPIEELNLHSFESDERSSWGLLFKGGASVDESTHDKEHLYKPGQKQLSSRNRWSS